MTATADGHVDDRAAAVEPPAAPPAAPPPPAPPPPPGPDAAEVLSRVFRTAGAVVAPTTLLTGLLLYFGRQHAFALLDHFGVQATVFELTPQDHLVRSADGLFVPLALAAASLLVVLWGRAVVQRAVGPERRRTMVRRAAPVLAVVGLALVAVPAVAVARPATFAAAPDVPGLLLAAGALQLAAAVHLLRRPAPDRRPSPLGVVAEWGAVFLLVAVGLFWSVGDYAGLVGRGRAVQIERDLAAQPDAVLFSERRLALGGVPGVTEYACADDDAADASAYRFRYDGLKLVLQAGGQYLFLPAGWTWDADRPAVVVPRTDALRLEFSAPGRAQVGSC